MMEVTMDRPDIGPGEAADRVRKRRMLAGVATLFVLGLPVGFFAAMLERDNDGGFLTGTLPPWFAVTAALVTIVAIIGGSIAMHRRIDELERRDNLIAGVMGANAVLALYPAWYILWRGQIVGEPSHEALFLIVFGVSTLTYVYLKLRQHF